MARRKIRICLKAYEYCALDQSVDKIVGTVKRIGASVSGPTPLPAGRSLYIVIRVIHEYENSREQFEMCTHKCLIDIVNPAPRTADVLMKLDSPSGVNIEAKL